MPFAENLGTGGGSLDAQYGSSPTANTNAPLLLDPRTSGNFVYTPGTAGNYVAVPHSPSLNILGTEGTPFLSLPGFAISSQYASSPDTGALDITGDIDLRCRAQLTPVVPLSGNANLITKGGLGGNYAFFFGVDTAGRLFFEWSNNGVTTTFKTSTVAATVPAGVPYWYRATMDADNGAGGNDIAFYVSPDGITWTQVGTTVTTAGVAVINNSASALQLGGYGGSSFTDGRIYRAQVLNGINGTVVFDADFTQQALGTRGFIESTGKLVSLVGNAAQIVDGTTYGTMPSTSVAGGWTVPGTVTQLNVSDFEITARLSMNDWNEAADRFVLGKYEIPGRRYWILFNSGRPYLGYDVGGGPLFADPGTSFGFTNGQTYWIRVRRISATGVVRFYWAADSETEPTVWTNVGGDRAGTAGALSTSGDADPLTIGARRGTTDLMISQGRFYRAIIRNANTGGTKVLDADFTRQLQFASTFTEGSANLATVTTVGAARIERDRDLDLRVKVALDDWTPSATSALVSKALTPLLTDTNRSYYLSVNTTGTLVLAWSTTGVPATQTPATSVAPGLADGSVKWVRVTLDVNNGANGHTVSFYTSDDGSSWTVLGSPIVATGATSIFPGLAPVEVGSLNAGGTQPLAGKFYNAEIRNGINGPAVLDIDFTDAITTGAETYLPDTVTEVIPEALQYLPNLGWGGTALNARFGSAVGADTNDPLLLTHTGTNYLYLPGGSNWAALPDTNFAGSGDVSIRMRVAIDWTTTSYGALIGNTNQTSTGFRFGTGNGARRLQFSWWDSGTASFRSLTADSDNPFAASTLAWVRVDLDRDTGAGCAATFYVAPDATNEPTAWAQVGSVITSATVANLAFAALGQQLGIGSQKGDSAANTLAGSYYRAIIYTDLTQTTKSLDVDFTTGVTSGAQATFTATVGGTVTINRSTSGRKSVAVVQDVLLFGTDDYLEVPDNDLLDFGATDSFTVMTAVRQWATPASNGSYVTKRSTGAGWLLQSFGPALQGYVAITDGVNSQDRASAAFVSGASSVLGLLVDRSTQTITSIVNASTGPTASIAAVGSLANGIALMVGRNPSGNFQDFEFRGSAVWRRALTSTELALVNTHYTTGPTAASTALMQQAVWWIDAGTRSVAQINRSTSGRKSVACARCTWLLGTDDFFEVPASNLFDFAQGQDYTLLVLHRGWWEQGTNDTLLATSSSTTASAAGWAMSNSSGDPWQAGGRHGDGSNGVTAVAPRRDVGALTGTFLVRDTATDTLTAFTGSSSGTPVTDTTTGTIGNTNVMRLGRLSTTGTEYLDAEVVAAVVWRRALTTAERNAVLAYYGV